MAKDFGAYIKIAEQQEALQDHIDQLCARGAFLYGKLNAVDPLDVQAIDDVMEQHFISDFDMAAFEYYQDRMKEEGLMQ